MCDVGMEEENDSWQLLNRLPLLSGCGKAVLPTLPPLGTLSTLSPTTSLSLLKTQFSSSLPTLPRHSLSHCSVSVLYQLTALLMDDHSLTGHYGNCLSYLDLTLSSLQCLPRGSLYLCVEFLSKARDSLKHRKRNINNRLLDTEELMRLNFLNRMEQLDQAMVVLREVLLVSIVRQHTIVTREQLDSGNRPPGLVLDSSTSSCDQDSPVMTRRVLLNNNTLTQGDNMKTPDRKVKEEGLLGSSEADVTAGSSLPAATSVEMTDQG
eukprot:GFUD01020715.1.p1 GENE.GFUD01020715.1~~GFUD01020715.1.p1  ORF type:complete len:265 (+),score=107.31 GFUD01020715.1:51-845(+)